MVSNLLEIAEAKFGIYCFLHLRNHSTLRILNKLYILGTDHSAHVQSVIYLWSNFVRVCISNNTTLFVLFCFIPPNVWPFWCLRCLLFNVIVCLITPFCRSHWISPNPLLRVLLGLFNHLFTFNLYTYFTMMINMSRLSHVCDYGYLVLDSRYIAIWLATALWKQKGCPIWYFKHLEQIRMCLLDLPYLCLTNK